MGYVSVPPSYVFGKESQFLFYPDTATKVLRLVPGMYKTKDFWIAPNSNVVADGVWTTLYTLHLTVSGVTTDVPILISSGQMQSGFTAPAQYAEFLVASDTWGSLTWLVGGDPANDGRVEPYGYRISGEGWISLVLADPSTTFEITASSSFAPADLNQTATPMTGVVSALTYANIGGIAPAGGSLNYCDLATPADALPSSIPQVGADPLAVMTSPAVGAHQIEAPVMSLAKPVRWYEVGSQIPVLRWAGDPIEDSSTGQSLIGTFSHTLSVTDKIVVVLDDAPLEYKDGLLDPVVEATIPAVVQVAVDQVFPPVTPPVTTSNIVDTSGATTATVDLAPIVSAISSLSRRLDAVQLLLQSQSSTISGIANSSAYAKVGVDALGQRVTSLGNEIILGENQLIGDGDTNRKLVYASLGLSALGFLSKK
jgi:hypothetical protein